jgi:acetyltransferase-like isoleucine patch superfamily enzyme
VQRIVVLGGGGHAHVVVEILQERGDHAHVAPGCHLAGSVTVGETTLLGAGVVVVPGVKIGAGVFVAAGLTVTRDVPHDTRVTRHAAGSAPPLAG